MKKLIILLILTQFILPQYGQIIADHTAVDAFDDIPQEYLDVVMSMLVDISGESHSLGYRLGMNRLESMDNSYQVETYSNDSPSGDTDQYLRIGRHRTMGEDYFFSQSKIADLKSHITSQNNSGNPYDVMGFGWCWDLTWHNDPGGTKDPEYNVRWAGSSVGGPEGDMRWGLDSDDEALTGNSVSMDTYLDAVESYIQHCKDNSIPTSWIFTTGPVDGNSASENGFQREIKHDYIRDYVAADESRVLFDYADILCWNNSGEQNMTDWNDGGSTRSHAQIHPDNMMDYDESWNMISHSEDGDHIGEVGAVRLAKAMWWMLARMAGWQEEEGEITTVNKLVESNSSISVFSGLEYLRVDCPDMYNNGDLKLYDMTGKLLVSRHINEGTTVINTSYLSPGPYFVRVSKDRISAARKVIIFE